MSPIGSSCHNTKESGVREMLMQMSKRMLDNNMESGVRERLMMTGRVGCKMDNNMESKMRE